VSFFASFCVGIFLLRIVAEAYKGWLEVFRSIEISHAFRVKDLRDVDIKG